MARRFPERRRWPAAIGRPCGAVAALGRLHPKPPSSDARPLSPSPVVELNRYAAVGLASGPEAGLALLAPLLGDSRLEDYQPLHAVRAELSRRSGDIAGAADAYRRAIALSSNAVERAELERRRLALSAKPDAIAAARTAGAVAASRAPKRCSRHWPLSHCLAQAR
jgi:hypothetical protein